MAQLSYVLTLNNTRLPTFGRRSTCTVEAHGFRVEHRALVLLLPAGCTTASSQTNGFVWIS